MPTSPLSFGRRWLPQLGVAVWLVGAVLIWFLGRRWNWGPGELVLAGAGWVFVLALLAREPVRNMFGPVFWFEALRLGRRRSTFVLRLLYVLAVVALLGQFYLSWLNRTGYYYSNTGVVPPSTLSGFANDFFNTFAVVQLIVAAFLTPAFVAGTITDEKERKTLHFLLATDLRNREIIFGKLAARLINILMFVLAGVPVLAFLQLFGGIDPDVALASTAVTVLTVCGLASLSIMMSVLCQRSRDAIAMSYVIAFAYVALSFVLAMVVRYNLANTVVGTVSDVFGYRIDWADFSDALASGNILYTFPAATRGGRDLDPDVIADVLGKYAAFWGLATAVMIGFATARIRRATLEPARGTTRKTAHHSTVRVRPAIHSDAMLWKEVFVTSTKRVGVFGWFFRFMMALLLMVIPGMLAWRIFFRDDYGYYGYRNGFGERWEEFQEGMNAWVRICTGVIGTIIFFGAAMRGASAIAGERDRDAWVSLLASPLTAWEMLRGKWIGCMLTMRGAYFTLLVIWIIGLIIGAANIFTVLLTIATIGIFTSAYSWIGLFWSTSAKTTLSASVKTFFSALFLSGGFWLVPTCCCLLPIEATSGSVGGKTSDMGAQFLLGFTPPFMAGFMPFNGLENDDLGPFALDRSYSIGPIPPILGMIVWMGVSFLLGSITYAKFVKETNRGEKVQRRTPKKRADEDDLDD
jgi:ABC-type transport system involved in multi-copper enzyme maturation permease subunit